MHLSPETKKNSIRGLLILIVRFSLWRYCYRLVTKPEKRIKKYDIINTLTTGYYCRYFISLMFVRSKLNIRSIGNVYSFTLWKREGSLRLGCFFLSFFYAS